MRKQDVVIVNEVPVTVVFDRGTGGIEIVSLFIGDMNISGIPAQWVLDDIKRTLEGTHRRAA